MLHSATAVRRRARRTLVISVIRSSWVGARTMAIARGALMPRSQRRCGGLGLDPGAGARLARLPERVRVGDGRRVPHDRADPGAAVALAPADAVVRARTGRPRAQRG